MVNLVLNQLAGSCLTTTKSNVTLQARVQEARYQATYCSGMKLMVHLIVG